ncbi:MAG: ABC transporter permease [Thermofilum sp.]|nr:ABC transporter permease [Thermofilum sp.]
MWAEIGSAVWHDRKAIVGLCILAAFTVMALLAPYIAPYDPFKIVGAPYQPPSAKHILGTDNLGRDVFSQVVWGARVSLFVGLAVALAVTITGVTVGLVAATSHPLIDEALMRLCDIMIIVPKLPLTVFTAALLGRGVYNIIIVLSIFGWPSIARVVRSEVLSIKQRTYVDAARVAGAGQLQIMLHIVLPNVLPLVTANALLAIISGIMSEASLSFLGLGDPSQMSWGTMIYFANIGGAIYHGCWAWVAVPGLCIALFGLGMHLLTSAINVVANPRLRRW